jgi:hypothetical protein
MLTDTKNLDNEVAGASDHDQSKLRLQWVTKICKVHDKTAAAIIELGETLNKAKAALNQHDQWLIIFEQKELPFSLYLNMRMVLGGMLCTWTPSFYSS